MANPAQDGGQPPYPTEAAGIEEHCVGGPAARYMTAAPFMMDAQDVFINVHHTQLCNAAMGDLKQGTWKNNGKDC